MAIVASFVALIGRFLGRILTTTLGWASVLLFGRIPQDRQIWLAALTFGSLAWVVLLIAAVQPDAGTLLLAFMPLPDWVDQNLVRLAMLVAAVALPAVLGIGTLLLLDRADRPRGSGLVKQALRGYVFVPALAIILVVLAVAGTVRKLRAVAQRRSDAHVALVVRPGRYDALVETLEDSLRQDDLVTGRKAGPSVLIVPARLLARIAGTGIGRLVPDRLVVLNGPDVELSVYPSDLALLGTKDGVARARAIVARDVRSKDAWFTTTKEAQELEDALAALETADPARRTAALPELDRRLVSLTTTEDEWEVLYRRRLQLVVEPAADVRDADGRDRGAARGTAPTGRFTLGSAASVALAALAALDLALQVWAGRSSSRRS